MTHRLFAFLAMLLVLVLGPASGARAADGVFFGYVEGDYTYVSPLEAGRLDRVPVAEGDMVDADAALFVMDDARARAGLDAARAQLAARQAEAQDLATGLRPEEIAVVEERLKGAKTTLALAQTTFERTQKLRERDAVPASQFDQDRAALENARAQVHQLEAELKSARLPARPDRRAAAREGVRAAQAQVRQAEIALDDRTGRAPAAARVDRVFFSPGEFVASGQPVVALLAKADLTFRFFVPEDARAALTVGDAVLVDCDGCVGPIDARITYMATDAQFTPPFIYSLEQRDSLVFLVEAKPARPVDLAVGQPIDVRLQP